MRDAGLDATAIGPLLAPLTRWQRELGWSHTRFAADVLGVSRPQWSHLRHGHRQLSGALLGRLVAQRPDLSYWITEQLRWQARRQGPGAA